MQRPVLRLLVIGGWALSIAALAGWLVDAIHRGHLGGVLIVATGLAALVIVPVLNARLHQSPPP